MSAPPPGPRASGPRGGGSDGDGADLVVFTARGVALGAAGFPDGEHHAMLIIVAPDAAPGARADDPAATAVARVEAEGWAGVTLLLRKAVTLDPGGIADETVRAAARSAVRDGCAFVVYRDPLPLDA